MEYLLNLNFVCGVFKGIIDQSESKTEVKLSKM